jgi:hypothetical protein
MPPKLTVTFSEPEKDGDAESQKIIIAGLPFTNSQISALLSRAKAEMPLRPIRFPILGEYPECFNGEEFVGWLLENVPEFGRDLDIVLVAARELTGREGLLRKLGEFGNEFENADDVYYQFRPKVRYILSLAIGYELKSYSLGFHAWSATVSRNWNKVPSCCLTVTAYCSGNRKDLWYLRRYREQGMDKRRAPLHPIQEGSDECRNRVS